MNNIYLSTAPATTKKLGKIFAETLKNYSPRGKGALIVGLIGELGGGKTTFVQGFAAGLGVKGKITSPTFVVMRKYPVKKTGGKFFHIDCYRIKGSKELESLGFKEITADTGNIVLIEWPEVARKILPKNMIWINFEHAGGNRRRLEFSAR